MEVRGAKCETRDGSPPTAPPTGRPCSAKIAGSNFWRLFKSGHIDIRTYDGYLSDFLGSTLPTSLLEVTGIYRKYSDPEPEKRMRAFLKVLREWECHEEKDDEKRYAHAVDITDEQIKAATLKKKKED